MKAHRPNGQAGFEVANLLARALHRAEPVIDAVRNGLDESGSERRRFASREQTSGYIVWREADQQSEALLECAVDSARAVQHLAGCSGTRLSALVVARTAIEGAALARLLIGGRSQDRVARMYAALARDRHRVEAPLKWTREQTPSRGTGDSHHDQRWTDVEDDARSAGLRIEDRDDGTAFVVRLADGKRVPIAMNTSSIIGSWDVDVLHAWKLCSGAAHSALWFVGDEIANERNAVMPGSMWSMAGYCTAMALNEICRLEAGYRGMTFDGAVGLEDVRAALGAIVDRW